MRITSFRLILLMVGSLVLLVACGSSGSEPAAPTESQTGDATHGKQVFESTCVSCHGIDAKGLPGLGKDLTASEFVASQTDTELVAFIKQGRPTGDPANTTGIDMPPKGGNPALTDEDIADVVAYLRTLQE